jgi:hypothetical protein
MEAARVGSQSRHLYGGELDQARREKRVFGWDLNDWSWDSERFVATPVPAAVALNGSPTSSEEVVEVASNGRGDSDKRKRVVVIDDDDDDEKGADPVGSSREVLSLRIGGGVVAGLAVEDGGVNEQDRNGKKIRMQGGSSNGPACQVEGCWADLSVAKDYHRRHRVCEMHAKANTAVVGNTVQRFCQQCSRSVLRLSCLLFTCNYLFVWEYIGRICDASFVIYLQIDLFRALQASGHADVLSSTM